MEDCNCYEPIPGSVDEYFDCCASDSVTACDWVATINIIMLWLFLVAWVYAVCFASNSFFRQNWVLALCTFIQILT